MNMMKSIEPAAIDPETFVFEPLMSMKRMHEVEEVCHSFGAHRRIVLTVSTKARGELVEALNALKAESDEDALKLLDLATDYVEHLKETMELAKAVRLG